MNTHAIEFPRKIKVDKSTEKPITHLVKINKIEIEKTTTTHTHKRRRMKCIQLKWTLNATQTTKISINSTENIMHTLVTPNGRIRQKT